METIVDSILRDSGRILQDYRGLLGDISQQAASRWERLINEGQIISLPELDDELVETFSLCSIDGASASEKLQTGDLMIAGSSLHDGARSKLVYEDDEDSVPSFSFADIRLHSSKNEKVLSSMRACTEICVLGAADRHDMAIIDGAYLGNFLTIIFSLQESQETAERIIEALGGPDADAFIAGLTKIFNLTNKTEDSQEIVALAKSDTSNQLVKEFIEGGSDLMTNDKILARYLLKAGEILRPRNIRSSSVKIEMVRENLERPDFGWMGFKWPVKNVLSSEEFQRLERMFGLVSSKEKSKASTDDDIYSQFTYLIGEKNLNFTYFKPHNFDDTSHALRMEFTTMRTNAPETTKQHAERAMEQAKRLAGYIDADVVTPSIKEPYSQYMVDREVKKPVSSSMKLLKSILMEGVADSGENAEDILGSYRS